MISPKTKSILSSVALGLLAVVSAQTTNAQSSSPGSMSLDHPVVLNADMVSTADPRRSTNGAVPLVGLGSFTGICAYHINGTGIIANCADSRITAGSRVFASVSEYFTAPGVDPFLGAARMSIHNVIPHAGGVTVWMDVEWGSPLNVQLSIFVDP